MRTLLETLGVREMVKEAIIGAAARVAGFGAKALVKNPGKALTAGFGVTDTMSGAAKISNPVSASADEGAMTQRITM